MALSGINGAERCWFRQCGARDGSAEPAREQASAICYRGYQKVLLWRADETRDHSSGRNMIGDENEQHQSAAQHASAADRTLCRAAAADRHRRVARAVSRPLRVARAFTVQDATYAASAALGRCAGAKGDHLLLPRSLPQIESDRDWFTANGIALRETVVTMIPLWRAPQYRP
jgi:hypothetical protein